MIDVKTIGVWGFEGAIRGMRMPYESFDKSDSYECDGYDDYHCYVCKYANRDFDRCERPYSFTFGSNDMELAKKLIKGGSEHRKFLRMIHVQAEVKAPRYFWQEADKYKWIEANSSSTMHLITKRYLTIDDFSRDDGIGDEVAKAWVLSLNALIAIYNEKKSEENFRIIKQTLPESYNQLRMIDTNYECLLNIYHQRKNHRLSEWHEFCNWELTLPYFEEFLEALNG